MSPEQSEAVALSAETVGTLDVPVPSYDRSKVTAGIVHFGVGGFHRAHQAMYLDQLMSEGKALDFGICGVGVMPFDLKMRDALVSQDCSTRSCSRRPTAAGRRGSSARSWSTCTPPTTRRR